MRTKILGSTTTGDPATTNLVTNPSFEVDADGWITGQTSLAASAEQAYDGTKSGKIVCVGANSGLAGWQITLPGAGVYSFSGRLWIPADFDGAAPTFELELFAGATGTITVNASLAIRDAWQRLALPNVTIGADVNGYISCNENGAQPTAGRVLYVDAWQAEAGAIVTPFTAASRRGFEPIVRRPVFSGRK